MKKSPGPPLINLPVFLREKLGDMSQAEFAMRIGISRKVVNEVINGKASASWRFAIGCEYVLGIKAGEMMKLQYDEELYRARLRAQSITIMETSLGKS